MKIPTRRNEGLGLEELRDRLTEIIEENNRRGWSDRNSLPVYFRLRTPGRAGDLYTPVEFAMSGQFTMKDQDGISDVRMSVIEGSERNSIKPTRKRKAAINAESLRKVKSQMRKPSIYSSGSYGSFALFGKGNSWIAREFLKWIKPHLAQEEAAKCSQRKSQVSTPVTDNRLRELVEVFLSE